MARVTHFEIQTDDPARAMDFYGKCFDWKFTRWGGDDSVDYWLIETGPEDTPGINGGLMPRRGEQSGDAVIAYVCTLDVESVDAAITAVESNGGQVVVPKNGVPGVGWLVYFKDTEGNIFGTMEADPNAS